MPTKKKLKLFSCNRLRLMIDESRMTIPQFAGQMLVAAPPDRISPSVGYIKGLVSGKNNRPSCDYVLLMAHVLDCTIDDLVEVVK